jgi:hypothetical protein
MTITERALNPCRFIGRRGWGVDARREAAGVAPTSEAPIEMAWVTMLSIGMTAAMDGSG